VAALKLRGLIETFAETAVRDHSHLDGVMIDVAKTDVWMIDRWTTAHLLAIPLLVSIVTSEGYHRHILVAEIVEMSLLRAHQLVLGVDAATRLSRLALPARCSNLRDLRERRTPIMGG
jgi:hypothetical protein